MTTSYTVSIPMHGFMRATVDGLKPVTEITEVVEFAAIPFPDADCATQAFDIAARRRFVCDLFMYPRSTPKPDGTFIITLRSDSKNVVGTVTPHDN